MLIQLALLNCLLAPCVGEEEFVFEAFKQCGDFDGTFFSAPGAIYCQTPDRKLKILK